MLIRKQKMFEWNFFEKIGRAAITSFPLLLFRWLVSFLRTRLTRISNDLTIKSIIRLGCCYWRCVWKNHSTYWKQFSVFHSLERRFCLSLSDNENFQMHRQVCNLFLFDWRTFFKIVKRVFFFLKYVVDEIQTMIINRCWYENQNE